MLIVDDDPVGAHLLAGILRGEGFAAHVIDDADLALELLRLLPIDLLIVDMMLPDMSGPDLVRVLRRAGVLAPIILVSGAPHDEIAAAAEASAIYTAKGERVDGANAWLPKPIDRATLLQTIDELVIRRSSLPPDSTAGGARQGH